MNPAVLRDDMVDSLEHDAKAVVRSERVSVAMRTVPREPFVAEDAAAYADRSFERLGTRVLSPSAAGRLFEALDVGPDDTVLVVGIGVGYTAAVLAELTDEASVHGIDIARRLVYDARSNLSSAGYPGVLVDCRDGARGLAEYAPYDCILLEAAAVEPPKALREQLAPGGRLVMPLGGATQTLVAIEGDDRTEHGTVAFHPMLVDGEQTDTIERNRTRREDREHARRDAERRKGWERAWIDWDRE